MWPRALGHGCGSTGPRLAAGEWLSRRAVPRLPSCPCPHVPGGRLVGRASADQPPRAPGGAAGPGLWRCTASAYGPRLASGPSRGGHRAGQGAGGQEPWVAALRGRPKSLGLDCGGEKAACGENMMTGKAAKAASETCSDGFNTAICLHAGGSLELAVSAGSKPSSC